MSDSHRSAVRCPVWSNGVGVRCADSYSANGNGNVAGGRAGVRALVFELTVGRNQVRAGVLEGLRAEWDWSKVEVRW